ncbi:MAG: DUF2288 family protein [bacterium]|nr:DUF2288 family protein [bacterium]
MELKNELLKNIGTASWKELEAHFAADTLICVKSDLDILSVGEDIALDKAEKIRNLLQTGRLFKPSAADMTLWQNSEQKFLCLIVAPFIIIQSGS